MKQGTTEELMQQHKGLVYYMLHKHRCASSDEAKSVAYEALWRSIETFDSNSTNSFSTYACTCIKNAIFGYFRKQKEVLDNEVSLEDYYELCVYDTYSIYKEDDVDYSFLSSAVDEVLNKLSGKRLKVAQLWLESNMSTTALAKEVPCSQAYASQIVAEIKALLRKELQNAGYTGDIS